MYLESTHTSLLLFTRSTNNVLMFCSNLCSSRTTPESKCASPDLFFISAHHSAGPVFQLWHVSKFACGCLLTYGFMLRWSLPPSGILAERTFPFSVVLPSVHVAAPPAEAAAGDVRPKGLEGFLLWISWTCFGSETASD